MDRHLIMQEAFEDELEKIALVKEIADFGRKFISGVASRSKPLKQLMVEGHRSLAPAHELHVKKFKPNLEKGLPREQYEAVTSPLERLRSDVQRREGDGVLNAIKRNTFWKDRHLLQPSQGFRQAFESGASPGQKFTNVMEEASRQGWTGEGRWTKYMPIGQKSLMYGTPLLSAPTIYRGIKDPYQEHGAGQEIGSQVGFLVPGLATASLMTAGMPAVVGSMAAGIGGSMLGGRLGKKVDQRRAERAFNAEAQSGNVSPQAAQYYYRQQGGQA